MRIKRISFLLSILLIWGIIVYALFLSKSLNYSNREQSKGGVSVESVQTKVEKLEFMIRQQYDANSNLLRDLQQAVEAKRDSIANEDFEQNRENKIFQLKERYKDGTVIPVLVFACNRVTVSRCLDQLLKYRPSEEQFPIIVSQDCGDEATRNVILNYGDKLTLIQQPDQSDIRVPPKEKKYKGYFKIARHYGWALNQTFLKFNFDTVIIVEDDLDIAPDFFEYFKATYPLLLSDKRLFCISAWNDNGLPGLINEDAPELLYRTDFFPGLGWMLTKDLWIELSTKWPKSYWDDWLRHPAQRKNRACLRPEVSRTKTFGKKGVSNGLFFDKHLKNMKLNEKFVPFTKMNLNFLHSDVYDTEFTKQVYQSTVVSYQELKSGKITLEGPVRIPYHSFQTYRQAANALGLMNDFKSGVPRTGYKGIVTFHYQGRTVYLAPNVNWKGYDIAWS